MATEDDVRRLALELPGVISDERHGQRNYTIEGKGIAWAYVARDKPKAKRTLRPGIVAIRCPIEEKEMLIEAAPASTSTTTTIAASRASLSGWTRSARPSFPLALPARSKSKRRSAAGARLAAQRRAC